MCLDRHARVEWNGDLSTHPSIHLSVPSALHSLAQKQYTSLSRGDSLVNGGRDSCVALRGWLDLVLRFGMVGEEKRRGDEGDGSEELDGCAGLIMRSGWDGGNEELGEGGDGEMRGST